MSERELNLNEFAELIVNFREKYVYSIFACVERHMNTLMVKYDQLSYTDDYGKIKIHDFMKELLYFATNVIPQECDLFDGLSGLIEYNRGLYEQESSQNKQDSSQNIQNQIERIRQNTQRIKESIMTSRAYNVRLIQIFNFDIALKLSGEKLSQCKSNHVTIDIQDNYYDEKLDYNDIEMNTRVNTVFKIFLWLKGNIDKIKGTEKRIYKDKQLTPRSYEKYITSLLKELGFKARTTKASGDQGADVLAEKGGVKFAIQCKMYSKPVGNKAVQEANTARGYYKCDYAVVVTNAGYTKSARQLANACGVVLLNDKQLDKLDTYANAQ